MLRMTLATRRVLVTTMLALTAVSPLGPLDGLVRPQAAPAEAAICPTALASGDTYACYTELARAEPEGVTTFVVTSRTNDPRVLVFSPAGGGIEPGTSELARAISGSKWSLYDFEGRKSSNNATLHLSNLNFDEPRALRALTPASRVVSVHGTSGTSAVVYLGGRDHDLRTRIERELRSAGFTVAATPSHLAHDQARDVTNRGRYAAGVSLELSNGLRRQMFVNGDLTRAGRTKPTATFTRFTRAVQRAIDASACPVRAGTGDTYACYQHLYSASEVLSDHYSYSQRLGASSRVLIFSPHGGGIELGSTELADRIAGTRWNYADWSGLRPSGNRALHITSVNYDEPRILRLQMAASRSIAVHGASGDTPVAYVGGLDRQLRDRVVVRLREAGFNATSDVAAHPHLAGTDAANVANLNRRRAGVQLELTAGLRKQLFVGNNWSASNRHNHSEAMERFARAVNRALDDVGA
jgi:phage replication-related protein YjqB (UPF0714/DUF867 family)